MNKNNTFVQRTSFSGTGEFKTSKTFADLFQRQPSNSSCCMCFTFSSKWRDNLPVKFDQCISGRSATLSFPLSLSLSLSLALCLSLYSAENERLSVLLFAPILMICVYISLSLSLNATALSCSIQHQ